MLIFPLNRSLLLLGWMSAGKRRDLLVESISYPVPGLLGKSFSHLVPYDVTFPIHYFIDKKKDDAYCDV